MIHTLHIQLLWLGHRDQRPLPRTSYWWLFPPTHLFCCIIYWQYILFSPAYQPLSICGHLVAIKTKFMQLNLVFSVQKNATRARRSK